MLLICVAFVGATTARASAPNIVVILDDDQPYLDGRLIDFMPNVNSIFSQHGTTFTDFHSESPLCCPARAGFLTGQHTHNHGVTENDAHLFNPSMSVATQLHAAGYHTLLAGKYMNGFESILVTPPGWDDFEAMLKVDYYNYDLYDNGSIAHYGSAAGDYSTDVIANRAVAALRRSPSDKPVFAWITPIGPHAPNTPAPRYLDYKPCKKVPGWSPPSYNEADVSDKPSYVRTSGLLGPDVFSVKGTCMTLQAVDDLVGSVRDELQREGRLNNTIFIFAGDNGMNSGEHRLKDKQAPYETQIPFFVSWPSLLGSTPRTIDDRIQNIDFAPTACAVAGCSMGPYPNGQQNPDGQSFLNVLLGLSATMNRPYALDEMPGVKQAGTHAPPPWEAITTTADFIGNQYHYIEYDTGERELYNLTADPWELNNLVNSQNGIPRDAGNDDILSQLRGELSILSTERG